MDFNYSLTYYKAVNASEEHYGMQYQEGINVDILPFNDNPNESCCAGGLYFSDLEHIFEFTGGNTYIYEVTIPLNEKVIQDDNKWRVHRFCLSNRRTIQEFIIEVLHNEFNNKGYVNLSSLTTLPSGVQFNNKGSVDLRSLITLPSGVQFNNGGYVYLRSLTTLPSDVQFNNEGNVNLGSLTTLPSGFEFNNKGDVYLRSLTTLPSGFEFNNKGDVYLKNGFSPK